MTETAFNVFLWLIILFLVSFVLNNLWRKIFLGKKYRIFLAPGVIVHELSHAVACRLTGAKIKEINFFLWDGGYVKHNKSKIPILGEFLISFAPILGGIVALFIFSLIFGLRIPLEIVNFQQPFFYGVGVTIQEIPYFIKQNWLKWQFWVFIYLVISIIICLVPSKTDIKNAFGGVLIIFLLGLIFHYFNFFPQFLGIIFNPQLGGLLVLGALLGFLAIFFTLLIFLLLKTVKK
jgi:hypothetical protein